MSAFKDPTVTPLPEQKTSGKFDDPVVNQPAQPVENDIQQETGFWDQVMNYGSQAASAVKDVVAPDNVEDLQELSTTFYGDFQMADTPVGMFNIVRKSPWAKDKKLSLDEDKYGNPVVVDESDGQAYYFNKPGASINDINLGKIGLMRIAPAVAAGAPVSALGKGMLAKSGLFGGAEVAGESAYQLQKMIAGADEGFDYNNVLAAGAFAMGGELAGRMLTPVVSRVWRKLFGKVDDVSKYFDGEKWTDEGIEFLKRAEVDMDTLDYAMQSELKRNGLLTPEQAKRYNFMKKQGMRPTRAQVTQDRADFADQQQLVRSGEAPELVNELDVQNRQMIDRAEAIKGKTGGIVNLRQSTSADITDYVTRRALADDAAVSAYYRSVRERLPDQKIIKTPKLYSFLKQNAPKDNMSQGALTAVLGDLKARGIINDKGKLVGRVSADTAEEIRKSLNQIFANGNPTAKMLATQAKEALDEDVFRYLGKDEFKAARAAKRKFHKIYTDFRQNKLQKRGANILEKLYDGSISPDRAFDRIMTGPVDDMKRLKSFLVDSGDEEGMAIWNNIRAQAIEDAIKNATRGGKTQLGDPHWYAPMFKRTIDGYTQKGKLSVLFEPDEITSLLDIMELGKIRQPIQDSAGSTALGHGPSAPAIEKATNLLANILNRSPTPGGALAAAGVRKAGDVAKNEASRAYMREAAQDAISPSKRSVDAIKRGMRASREAKLTRISGPAGGLTALGGYQALGGDETENTQPR